MRWTSRTSSPSSVGNRSRFARRRAPVEPPALERRERRVERLQRRDVRRPGLHDRERAHRLVELATPGLHLRKLGHLTSVVHGSDPIRVIVRRGGVVEATHLVHAVAVQRRPPGRGGRRRRARHALPLLGEAVPGAAARARPTTTSTRASSPIASASHCADREQLDGRADAARARARRRGRPRVRPRGPPAVAAQAQLLRQARRHARRLPRARLAHRGLPPAEPPDAAHESRATSPPRRGVDEDGDRDRGRRLRRPDVRPVARARWPTMFTRLEASAGGRARRRRDARAPGADPRRRARPDTVVMQTLAGAVAKGGAEGLLCGVLAGRRRASRSSARTARGRALGPRRRGVPRASRRRRSTHFVELPVANSRGENVSARSRVE